MLLVIFCLIRPIYSLFAKADFPDALPWWEVRAGEAEGERVERVCLEEVYGGQ